MAGIVERVSKNEPLSPNIIDDISTLLSDRYSRLWAARALGSLGPQAVQAIPALQVAQKVAVKDGAYNRLLKVSDADAISGAIAKIRNDQEQ